MNKILVAIVAAGIAFGSTASLAADAAKPELTKEDRAEMRNRAERLTAERAHTVAQPVAAPAKTSKVAKQRTAKHSKAKTPAAKPHKATTPAVKKVEPKV